MGRGAALSLAVVLLAGCGGGAQVLSGPTPEASGTPAARLDHVDWQLTTIRQGGHDRDVSAEDATLHFDGKGKVSGHGCNYFGGDVDVTGDSVKAGQMSSTLIGCTGVRQEIDQLTSDALTAGATWLISDGRLALSGHGVTLLYRQRASGFASQAATPLVQGQIGTAEYRLSADAAGGQVSVTWESREDSGTGMGSSGIGRAIDEHIGYLDPMGATVAGRGFVYVAAPLGFSKVTYGPPGGPVVELTSYDVPTATTWRIYAGFVGDGTKGGVAIAYDKDGNEVMRSRVLPY